MTKTLTNAARSGLIALLAITLPMLAQAAHHEEAQTEVQDEVETNSRAMAIELVAEVTAIDLETREVTLQGPEGDSITIVSPETVAKLEDVSVGDLLVVTYISALEGELREPTEEELAEPWLELEVVEKQLLRLRRQQGVADIYDGDIERGCRCQLLLGLIVSEGGLEI